MANTQNRTPLHTGGCQCGAVRFAVYVEPKKIGLCHCRMCQKAVAGPFAVLAEVPWGDFAWTRSQPAAFQSSSRAARDFCAACGTPLSYRHLGGPIIELLTGAFDEPERVAPTYAMGTESQLTWVGAHRRHARQVHARELRRCRGGGDPEPPAPRSRHRRRLAAEARARHVIGCPRLADGHRLRPVHQRHQHVADDHQQEPGAELAERHQLPSRGAGWGTSRRR